MENQNLLNEPVLQLGATSITLGNILLAGIVVVVLCLIVFSSPQRVPRVFARLPKHRPKTAPATRNIAWRKS